MRFVCDFHLHSRYSRGTSNDMGLEHMARWAKLKGISLLGTGDFTHPAWFLELKEKLRPSDLNGLYEFQGIYFMLTAEVANFFQVDGKGHKMHNLIFSPSLEVSLRINQRLRRLNSLSADGRPALSVSSLDLLKIVKDISPDAYIVPAHAWTPWFSLFGSRSGFDSIEECFGDASSEIFAIETGLSSDPPMNWRLSALDRVTLISNSDAHSPSRIGREANVFSEKIDFYEIKRVLQNKDRSKFLFTIEFFPEEGKYHFDGHRFCNVLMSPEESRKHNLNCPVCGKPLTVGVMHRVEDLADRKDGFQPENAIPFKRLIPLDEIIAQVLKKSPDSVAVQNEYFKLIQTFSSELSVLLDAPIPYLEKMTTLSLSRAIACMREGKVKISPGYDGEYGKIEIDLQGDEEVPQPEPTQISLF